MANESSSNSKKIDPNSWRGKIKSQTLWGIMLVPSFWCLLIVYVVLAFLLLLVGIIMLAMANNINTYEVRYDVTCTLGQADCNVTFTPDVTLKSPKIYYKLDNFYGNHRNFIKSRSFMQLRDSTSSATSDCSPVSENEDVSTPLNNLNNIALDPSDDANPCGLAAKYWFDDDYMLYNTVTTSQITIKETGIAHSVDKNSRFKNTDNYLDKQWVNKENEHFMIWFQTDAFPTFIKLWGKVQGDLMKGTQYRIQINNQWDSDSIDVKKYVYFSETNAFGGDNPTFGILYTVAG